jgi:hypothetical protein
MRPSKAMKFCVRTGSGELCGRRCRARARRRAVLVPVVRQYTRAAVGHNRPDKFAVNQSTRLASRSRRFAPLRRACAAAAD